MSMPFYVAPEQVMKDRADYARKGIARGRSVAQGPDEEEQAPVRNLRRFSRRQMHAGNGTVAPRLTRDRAHPGHERRAVVGPQHHMVERRRGVIHRPAKRRLAIASTTSMPSCCSSNMRKRRIFSSSETLSSMRRVATVPSREE